MRVSDRAGTVETRQAGARRFMFGAGRDITGIRTATDGRDMLLNTPDGWEVSQPWLWWAGPAGGDGTGGPLGNPPPGAREFWKVPAAVTRCTSLICDTLAGMPWQVRRDRAPLPVPAWIADPQSLRRDARIDGGPVPATRRSAVEFRSWLLKSCVWFGEGIIYVPHRNDDGSPAPPVWQLHPDYVAEDGGRYYIPGSAPVTPLLAEDYPGPRADYEFAPDELIVMRGMLGDGPRGVGVLRAHFWELMMAGLITGYAANMLRFGVPPGYLKVNAPQLTRDKALDLQRDWMRAHGGTVRSIAVLNATTEFHKLGLDPVALELAKMRDYSTLDIALIFGVPPYMLGLTQASDTYANVESRMIELSEFTLLPWARRAEATFDAELPRGTDMKINLDGLRRADTKTRYEAHKIALDAGFLLVDEVREIEDRPPVPAEAEAAQMAALQRQLRLVGGTGAGTTGGGGPDEQSQQQPGDGGPAAGGPGRGRGAAARDDAGVPLR